MHVSSFPEHIKITHQAPMESELRFAFPGTEEARILQPEMFAASNPLDHSATLTQSHGFPVASRYVGLPVGRAIHFDFEGLDKYTDQPNKLILAVPICAGVNLVDLSCAVDGVKIRKNSNCPRCGSSPELKNFCPKCRYFFPDRNFFCVGGIVQGERHKLEGFRASQNQFCELVTTQDAGLALSHQQGLTNPGNQIGFAFYSLLFKSAVVGGLRRRERILVDRVSLKEPNKVLDLGKLPKSATEPTNLYLGPGAYGPKAEFEPWVIKSVDGCELIGAVIYHLMTTPSIKKIEEAGLFSGPVASMKTVTSIRREK